MLLAALILIGIHQGACPTAFSSTNTTIGALSNSQVLSICVANSVLVHGSNGSITLVVGATSPAPRCLIYPNGLSPDLTLNLLESGHVNCWSLYPPAQSVLIVNVGKPSTSKIRAALKSFSPQVPIINVSPSSDFRINKSLKFSSNARTETVVSSMLNLPVRIRFTPKTFSWNLGSQISHSASPNYTPRTTGELIANLGVGYGIEYEFPGLTSWMAVTPNLLSNAIPLLLEIGDNANPKHILQAPRLVLRPCSPGRWGC